MEINRFPHNLNHSESAKKNDDKNRGNAFQMILQREYDQLMQLVADAQINGATIELYQKCTPREFDNMFPEE